MQIEFLYKLNLPDLKEVLISPDILKQFIPNNLQGSKIFYPEPAEIFKSEWLNFKGYTWDYCSLFVRSGNQNSIIHRDNPFSPNSLHWGINWVLGKDSFMDYWNTSQIRKEEIIVDSGGEKTVILEINEPPIKSYLTENGVYLVNASAPHRVRNESGELRVAISLRSKTLRMSKIFTQWDEVVNDFETIIQTK
jgi:hypothetical protein